MADDGSRSPIYLEFRARSNSRKGNGFGPTKLVKTTSLAPPSDSDIEEPREDIDHAVDFLSSIDTGSVTIPPDLKRRKSVVASPTSIPVESLSEANEWISSKGTLRRSYGHNLTTHTPYRVRVDLSAYPAVLRSGPLRDSLNYDFANRYPFLDRKLKLSTLVNLREMYIVLLCKELDIEACTVALAWAYFNKLLDWNSVTRYNRKEQAGACILLAYKFIEETTVPEAKQKLRRLLNAIGEGESDTLTSAILRAEFEVYARLKFDLHIPAEEFEGVFELVLSRMERTRAEYLDSLFY